MLEAKGFAAVDAFSAPWSMKMLEIDAVGMFDTAAEEMGKLFITTELGGGGTSRAETVRIARRGVLNVLRHARILPLVRSRKTPTQWLDMPSGDCFSFAEDDGMIETMIDLGEPAEDGQVLARIHAIGRTGAAPQGDQGENVRPAGRRYSPDWSRPVTASRSSRSRSGDSKPRPWLLCAAAVRNL